MAKRDDNTLDDLPDLPPEVMDELLAALLGPASERDARLEAIAQRHASQRAAIFAYAARNQARAGNGADRELRARASDPT